MPPRDGRAFDVPAGHLFRIVNAEGSQVGDLNLWNAADLARTVLQRQDARAARDPRQHRATGCGAAFPWLRPMATITPRHPGLVRRFDEFGAGVHDRDRHPLRPLHQSPPDAWGTTTTAATRNLTRALAEARNLPPAEAEPATCTTW